MKNLLIFASGSATGGGSGFEQLVIRNVTGELKCRIVGVVSNHENGGVKEKAQKSGVPFYYFNGPFTAENYQHFVQNTKADFVALSGWIKPARGLDPRTTFNIHPGPLPKFGGKGMYGHHVHEAVLAAFRSGKIQYSAVTMHFVTEEYDKGPICMEVKIPIYHADTVETLAARVNQAEHEWQWVCTNKIIKGEISWNGVDPFSVCNVIRIALIT